MTQEGVIAGPYAVFATDDFRSGTAYDVVLVSTGARIAARATAIAAPFGSESLRSLLPRRVSASLTRAYFLDGATEIRWLLPDGTTGTAKSIPEGITNDLTFAVSPDDRRIAVTLFSRDADPALVTVHTYVEDLAASTGHVDVASTRGLHAARWVVGWHGGAIIEATGGDDELGCNGFDPLGCVRSYRLLFPATGRPPVGLCELNTGISSSTIRTGMPSSAGVACHDLGGSTDSGLTTGRIFAVDWGGRPHAFATSDFVPAITVGGCFLSPDGLRMACISNANRRINLLTPGNRTSDLGFGYRIIGWLDDGHLAVAVDAETLGVLAVDRGATRLLPFPTTDAVEFAGSLPNPL